VTVFTDSQATAPGSASGAGDGPGSLGDLRSQILAANAFGGPGNSIAFICNALPCTITLNGPLPPIASNLTIDGGTFGNVVIDGASSYRVFFVDSGTVLIANLQIQNAAATGGAGGLGIGGGGGGAGFGAGLFVNQITASVSAQTVLFKNVSATGGNGGAGFNDGDLPGFSGAGGGGMGFSGANGDLAGNSRGGGGGGGIQGAGGAFNGSVGGNGGAGGGGAAASNGNVGFGTGGSAYAGNTAGQGGGSHLAGAGGFGGGGGGGDCTGAAGAGGFGGGGGSPGSCFGFAGGAGGFGGGGGGGGSNNGGASPSGGGVAGGTGGRGDNVGNGGGGGGGGAAGPAIFVASGSISLLNSTATGTITATGGSGGAAPAGGTTAGGNGTADATPVFNHGGTVNGSNVTGAAAGALGSGLPATHFSVVALTPVTSFVNNGSGVTVTALDSNNAIAAGYNGIVHLTSSDPGFVNATGDSTLSNGVGSFNFGLKTAGAQTITATDTVLANITGTSNNVTVVPGPAVRLVVSAPATANLGTAFNFTVTAQDLFGNTATSYTGTVNFTSSDGSATLPAPSTLTNGVGTLSATLRTAGTQTITAADLVNAISGTSGNIAVLGPAPTVTVGFSPGTVEVFGASTTTLTLTVTNPNAFAVTGLALSDNLPAGLTADSYSSFTCQGNIGSSFSTAAGAFSFTGFNLAANASCQVVATLHATTQGLKTNTTSTATSNNAVTAPSASANLTVNPDSAPALGEAFGSGSIGVGSSTSLTFTVSNPNQTVQLQAINFSDALPAGLVVSTPNGLANTCGGAATAVAGSSSISLAGVTLLPNTSCTLSVTVRASVAGTLVNTTGAIGSNLAAGTTATATLSVQPPLAYQTINFPPIPNHTYGDAPFVVNVSATSGLPVSLSISGSCVPVQGSPLTARIVAAGSCLLIASQSGGQGYGAALTATRTVSIIPATLTVTANNATMTAGGPLPALSATISGLVNGDTMAAISGTPALATTANSKSAAGTYPITVSTGSLMSANYTFAFVGGTLTVTAATGPGGQISIQNSASLTAGAVSPNTILALYNPPAGCTNAQVLIDGISGQVLFENATQINFVVPGTVPVAATAQLQVVCANGATAAATVPYEPVNPAIFTLTGTGSGQGAVINQDGTINGPNNPAPRGGYVWVFGTGFGTYNAPGANGLTLLTYAVTASIGGVAANVEYAGAAPTETSGLQQINIPVPANVTPGASVPILLTVQGTTTAASVTIVVQ